MKGKKKSRRKADTLGDPFDFNAEARSNKGGIGMSKRVFF